MQRLDAEQDDQSIADAAKNFNRLENVLLQNRTLTLFGEINQDVARRMAEKLLALAFESDDPITLVHRFAGWSCRIGRHYFRSNSLH